MKRAAALIAVALLSVWAAHAQRFAVLQPSDEGAVPGFADALRSGLTARARLVDTDLAFAAFRSVAVAEPFNMSADEARRVGSVIGCDRFVILRSALQRRAGAQGRSYFEAYSATYLIDARSGLLIRFDLTSAEAPAEAEAAAGLLAKIHGLSAAIANAKFEPQKNGPNFPEPPPENSPEADGLKLPIPYKRIRPEYTTLASVYSVRATVDIEANIDADGHIVSSKIVRWAGFGLEEAVERAVRSMNWRPAMRNGKALPMRVLLRYNFRKVEKDEEA